MRKENFSCKHFWIARTKGGIVLEVIAPGKFRRKKGKPTEIPVCKLFNIPCAVYLGRAKSCNYMEE